MFVKKIKIYRMHHRRSFIISPPAEIKSIKALSRVTTTRITRTIVPAQVDGGAACKG